MGLSRRKRAKVQAEVKAAMGEFAAAVQTRLNTELARSNQAQVAMLDAMQALHAEMRERDAVFATAFTKLGNAINGMTNAIESDRDGRRQLTEAVTTLNDRELEAPAAARVIGGRATSIAGALPTDIEMVRDEADGDDISVHR